MAVLNQFLAAYFCHGGSFPAGYPAFTQQPYAPQMIFAGDNLDSSAVEQGIAIGTPTPTLSSVAVLLNGVSQGTTYQTVSGDAGSTIEITQDASNVLGTRHGSSGLINITTPVTFYGLGYMGGNVEGSQDFRHQRYFSNLVRDGRGFGGQGANTAQLTTNAAENVYLTLSATSGSGVTMTISNTAYSALNGDIRDVGKLFNVITASVVITVTGFTSTSACTVSIAGTLPSTTVASGLWTMLLPLDANGWPTIASGFVLTTPGDPQNTIDGQVAAGTYHGKVTWLGNTVTQSVVGVTLTNVVSTYDGTTTTVTYDIVVPTAATIIWSYSGPINGWEIPRDGSYPTGSQPLFSATAITHYAKFSSLRFMDFLSTNTRLDKTWSARPLDYYVQSGRAFSWETFCHFVLAVLASSGSRLQNVHMNVPAGVDTNYIDNLTALFNTFGLGILIVENSNETWNNVFVVNPTNLAAAAAETLALTTPNYPFTGAPSGLINSIVGNGTIATVTFAGPVTNYSQLGQTVGATVQGVAFNSVYSGTGPNAGGGTVLAPATFTTTDTGSVSGHAVITYPCTSSFASITTTQALYFNLASTLLTDNLSYSIFDLGHKYSVRQCYNVNQEWIKGRPNDRFILNVQPFATALQGSNRTVPVEFPYATYISGSPANTAPWLWGASNSNYIQPTSAVTVTGAGTLSTGGVTTGSATFTSTLATTLTGTSADVGQVIVTGGTYATITAAISTTQCTATIIGTLSGSTGLSWTLSSPTAWFAQANALITPGTGSADASMRGLVFLCRLMGLHPILYEFGLDWTNSTPLVIACSTDSRMTALMASFLDCVWLNGIEIANYFHVSPVYWTAGAGNQLGNSWSLLEDYADSTSSLRWAAWNAYQTRISNYANVHGGGSNPIVVTSAHYQTYSVSTSNGAVTTTGGTFPGSYVFYWNSGIGNRLYYLISVPRTRRYKAIIRGTDQGATPQFSLEIDLVSAGTTNLVAGGYGSSTTSNLADSTAIVIPNLTAGPHIVSVTQTSAGAQPGISQIAFVTY